MRQKISTVSEAISLRVKKSVKMWVARWIEKEGWEKLKLLPASGLGQFAKQSQCLINRDFMLWVPFVNQYSCVEQNTWQVAQP